MMYWIVAGGVGLYMAHFLVRCRRGFQEMSEYWGDQ